MDAEFRPAAHVWIDALSAAEGPEATDEAIQVAWEGFNDVGAISATMDDDTDVVTVDGTPLLRSALLLITMLVQGWSRAEGVSRDQIIVWLRDLIET